MTIASSIRPAIGALAAYRPGKGAAQAEAEHGITEAIKLASNENPFPPIQPVIEAIAAAASGVNRYPDHRATELRTVLGEQVGVAVDQVAVGCGSVGLLQQLCLTFVDPGDEVVFPWLSFEAYPVCVKMMGGVPVNPPLVDHAFDLEAVIDAVTDKTKMILLATPNNPTGTALSTAQIADLLARVPTSVIVVVDEAYREFADPALGDPVAELTATNSNLVVTRTFSKAYGLAGLRVGYAVCDPLIVSEIDKILIPFAVNGPAQAAALAALANLDQIQPEIDRLLTQRARLTTELEGAGWALPSPQGNFVYLPTGDRTDEIYLALERQGVVTRPFSGDGIRVTVGTEAENDRFLAALAPLTHF